jgi:hypothetical protein
MRIPILPTAGFRRGAGTFAAQARRAEAR